ncbi:MAPEG family protein [uncultured Tateyamaria sp.]|uniref:MAPEG family protein n=1 Tax=uncultured Tateyamaria sp. TaxID=455651 RepID=UPI00260B8ED6|nr:MAPEG family protein [uncultured Tateyamaria sp.]
MTPELTALTLAALLQVLQFYLMALPTNIELPQGKTLSPRDRNRMGGDIQDQVSDKTARLIRAWNNHFESLALFTIACVVITLSDQSTSLTAVCAWTYLIARILYIPAYYFGLIPWRSLIWFTGFTATTLMLIAALIPSSG